MPKTIDEEQGRRNHHQQGWQIHLAEEEICPKNRSHPLLLPTAAGAALIALLIIAASALALSAGRAPSPRATGAHATAHIPAQTNTVMDRSFIGIPTHRW
jgi:hypothetical protein